MTILVQKTVKAAFAVSLFATILLVYSSIAFAMSRVLFSPLRYY